MHEPPRDDLALGRALRDLAPDIVYPPTPDLTRSVRAAVVDAEVSQRGHGFGWRPFGRSLPAALIALVLIAGAALAAGIGLRGLSIVFVDSSPAPIGQSLELGERMSLEDAQRRVSYRILAPAGDLGLPREVYLDVHAGVEQVSLVYGSDMGSESGGTDTAALLITQFAATSDIAPTIKEVGPGTTAEPVVVDGLPGFWIEGSPHALIYLDASGAQIEDRVRLVGDVLAWQRGNLTLRIEGATSKEAALGIAESME
jgi:hypothetical protein